MTATRPALIVCDEAGFGVPIDPAEPRLWISAVCLPLDRLDCLGQLSLSKGRRLNRTDRDVVAELFRNQADLVGAVAFIDATDPEVREYYSESTVLGEHKFSGPGLLWSQGIANCCALVVSELHKAGAPFSPITVTHDPMTLSDEHRTGLQEVVESVIPRIMQEALDSLDSASMAARTPLAQLHLGKSDEAPEGALMLADFLASASRKSWMIRDTTFMEPLSGGQIILAHDITAATLANIRAATASRSNESR